VCVRSTPPPKPKASVPTTVPTPIRYEPKENGMLTSTVRKMNARIAVEVPAICLRDPIGQPWESSRSFKSSPEKEGVRKQSAFATRCFRSTLRSCYPTNEGQRGQSQSVFVPLLLWVKLGSGSASTILLLCPNERTSRDAVTGVLWCQNGKSRLLAD
jgi:hypothetical protein